MTLLEEAFNYYNKEFCGRTFAITFGDKNKNTSKIIVKFLKENFKHIFGMQYLIDISVYNMSARTVYYYVKKKMITIEDLKKSKYYYKVEERLLCYTRLGEIIRNGKVIYDGPSQFLGIKANYLMYLFNQGILYHLFYVQKDYFYVPCSYFPRNGNEYILKHKMFSIISCEEI